MEIYESSMPSQGETLSTTGPTIIYVTYLEDGSLDGHYIQPLQPEHEGRYIIVSEQVYFEWYAYRANAARDGVELIPPPPPQPMSEKAAWDCARYEIERVALSFGYDCVDTAVLFANDANAPSFSQDGQALKVWRAQMYEACASIIGDARAGNRTLPITSSGLVAELTAIAPAPVKVSQFP